MVMYNPISYLPAGDEENRGSDYLVKLHQLLVPYLGKYGLTLARNVASKLPILGPLENHAERVVKCPAKIVHPDQNARSPLRTSSICAKKNSRLPMAPLLSPQQATKHRAVAIQIKVPTAIQPRT